MPLERAAARRSRPRRARRRPLRDRLRALPRRARLAGATAFRSNMLPEPPYLPAVGRRLDAGGAVLDRQARAEIYRHAGLAGAEPRRRGVGGHRLPAAAARTCRRRNMPRSPGRGEPPASPDEPPLPETPGRALHPERRGADRRLRALSRHRRRGPAERRLSAPRHPDAGLSRPRARRNMRRASGRAASCSRSPRRSTRSEIDAARPPLLRERSRGSAGARGRSRSATCSNSGGRSRRMGIPDRQIAACSACHGLEEGPENPLFPALAGQYAGLHRPAARRSGRRASAAAAPIRRSCSRSSRNMSAEEIEAVALYYARACRRRRRSRTPSRRLTGAQCGLPRLDAAA